MTTLRIYKPSKKRPGPTTAEEWRKEVRKAELRVLSKLNYDMRKLEKQDAYIAASATRRMKMRKQLELDINEAYKAANRHPSQLAAPSEQSSLSPEPTETPQPKRRMVTLRAPAETRSRPQPIELDDADRAEEQYGQRKFISDDLQLKPWIASDQARSLRDAFNTGDYIEAITAHRVDFDFATATYTVKLHVNVRPGHVYKTGWKTELEVSWIALNKLLVYWDACGGRVRALESVHPGSALHCKTVLAILGHRKVSCNGIEVNVVYQGTSLGDATWENLLHLRVRRCIHQMTLEDYCRAAGIEVPPWFCVEFMEERTVNIDGPPAWVFTRQ